MVRILKCSGCEWMTCMNEWNMRPSSQKLIWKMEIPTASTLHNNRQYLSLSQCIFYHDCCSSDRGRRWFIMGIAPWWSFMLMIIPKREKLTLDLNPFRHVNLSWMIPCRPECLELKISTDSYSTWLWNRSSRMTLKILMPDSLFSQMPFSQSDKFDSLNSIQFAAPTGSLYSIHSDPLFEL